MMGESGSKNVSLAYHGLDEIPPKILRVHGSEAIELDLSHNNIHDFRNLFEMPNLSTLILDHNGLESQVKFPPLPNLHTLWVNNNYIDNLSHFIATVSQSFPNLHALSMMNNDAAPSYFNGGTFMQHLDYRHYVISQIPCLEVLDDTVITDNERSEAERIYPRISISNRTGQRRRRKPSSTDHDN